MKREYKVIRSSRRTIGITVNADGVTVRAPRNASRATIENAIRDHSGWIEKKLADAALRERRASELPPITDPEVRELARRARTALPPLAAEYADRLGVTYGRIAIRCQKTRWGSCSSKGNLNFNCLLMLAPENVIRCVVAHEICHRVEMNHSARFYALLDRLVPDRRECEKWLRTEGKVLMKRRKTD